MAHNKQRNCDICDTQGHMSYLHQTKDYEKRHEIIQQLGYEPFQDWFHEFEFRNWWQLNGRIDVPLCKIPRRIAGNNKIWRDGDPFPIGIWSPPECNESPPNKCIAPSQRSKIDSKPSNRVSPRLLGKYL